MDCECKAAGWRACISESGLFGIVLMTSGRESHEDLFEFEGHRTIWSAGLPTARIFALLKRLPKLLSRLWRLEGE